MREFHLKIVTPDGLEYDGAAESLLARTESGDVEILAGHTDYFAPLGIGRVRITVNGEKKIASSAGGFISVTRDGVMLVATTFEFADDIDLERAKTAKEKAEEAIKKASDDRSVTLAKAKLARAINRINVADLIKTR